MITVMHLITGLKVGGAEVVLFRLLEKMDRTKFRNIVVSMTDKGDFGDSLLELGIDVYWLDMQRHPQKNISGLIKLINLLKKERPDILQTWMYHADLLGGLVSLFFKKLPVIWGIHNINLQFKSNKIHTVLVAKICACLSRSLPVKIVCVSEIAKQEHVKFGYVDEKIDLIPNGIDPIVFVPDKSARLSIRQELDIPKNMFLIGFIGRFHPIKNHREFLLAASMVLKKNENVRFLFCGADISWQNKQLTSWIEEGNIANYCYLLEKRKDMPTVTASLDVAVSFSQGESFSLVIAEAMSCAVPCVAAGDAPAAVIGNTGIHVSSLDYSELANSILLMLNMPVEERNELGLLARQRIQEHFSLAITIKKYQTLYRSICD